MSVLSNITQGTPAQSTNSQSSVSGPDAWVQDYYRNVLGASMGAAAEPFQTFQGPRVAPLSPLQQQAAGLAGQNAQAWTPFVQNAMSQTYPGAAASYMNPYNEQVTNRIAQLGTRNLQENILPGITDAFTGSGQFGSSRYFDFLNRAVRDTNESVMGLQGNLLQQGWNNGANIFNQDMSRQIQGAQTGAQIGNAGATLLSGLGALEQGVQQKSFDTAYNDFVEQRNMPMDRLSWLMNLPKSMPTTTTSTSGTTQQNVGAGPSPLQTLSSLASLWRSFSGPGDGSNLTAARGGSIQRRGPLAYVR